MTTGVEVRRLRGFDDPLVAPDDWERLLRTGETDVVFLTPEWLQAWWETLGDGELVLLAAFVRGQIVALAPWFAHRGMVLFLGSGQSDYMDLVGDVSQPEVGRALLQAARNLATGFVGFRFYAIPESSSNGARLSAAGEQLGLSGFSGHEWVGPFVDLSGQRDQVLAAANGPKLRKRERFFQRGELELRQFTDAAAIASRLDAYFAQHIERWKHAKHESPFVEPRVRAFYERMTVRMGPTGRLRFSCLDWNGRTIAYEYGWSYQQTYFGGPSCFAEDLARRSPGQVLERQLMLAAISAGIGTYDFGIGDEPYKFRYATGVRRVQTWELYSLESV